MLAIYHPDIVWEESTGFPYITGDGIFHGPKEVVENIFKPLAEHIDSFHIDIKELFGADKNVVMTGYFTGTWQAILKKFMANDIHVYTLENGNIIHFYERLLARVKSF